MKTNSVYTIVLADDHIVLRDALASFIDTHDEYKVIAKADNGKELVSLVALGNHPDLVILDLNMPIMDGYETAKWLRQNSPTTKILVLTMYDAEITLIRLLQEGVRGFVKKDIHPNELHKAISAVIEQGYYYSNQTNAKLSNVFFKTFETKSSLEKGMLTQTEIEFLKLVSSDMTYKEIASTLYLSPRTIDHYRETLFAKLDVKSRVGLAIYAIKSGIVSFD
ncbi:MAG: response regulator transcription factor [Rhizobacter sp.]|nr:response regulator transcription factor [Ferruginibacter sp.]